MTVGSGSDFGRTNGGAGDPMIVLEFSPHVANALIQQIFAPHVRSEHCFVGLSLIGEQFEVTAYCVVEIPMLVAIPGVTTYGIGVTAVRKDGPFLYIIGTAADFSPEAIATFLDRKKVTGRFLLGCGSKVPGRHDGLIEVPWHCGMECLEEGRTVARAIAERVGMHATDDDIKKLFKP